ncbi:MAG: metal ABC transporter permease [Dehalococcoidia bacterium]|nr:metal ABC transporter permease [Dehalococcoidia bacterium]
MDILQYAFMQRALISAVVVGTVCSVIGVYVILKGLSFIGAGIAHASFGGVALGFILGWNLVGTALIFCLATAWGVGLVSRKGRIREDVAIGILFSATMALGILLVSLLKGYNVDLIGFLFGSVLAVTPEDLWLTVVLALAILLVVGLLYKELLFITFDTEMAQVVGLPATALYFLLLGLMAVTIVVSIKVVGIILVEALIVTPAATAYQLTTDFRRMMVLSVAIGVGAAVAGLFFSYWLNTPSGGTMVLTATIVFFLAALLSPKKRLLRLTRVIGKPST